MSVVNCLPSAIDFTERGHREHSQTTFLTYEYGEEEEEEQSHLNLIIFYSDCRHFPI